MDNLLEWSDYDDYVTNHIKNGIYFSALERSLLILGAFVYFDILDYYKKYIIKNFPYGKQYYKIISLILHLLFIFVLDLFLLYTFAFIFNTPI